MTIELRPEDLNKLQGLVATGHFSDIQEALHKAIDSVDLVIAAEQSAQEGIEWRQYASDRIEAGWADMQADRTIPGEDVHAWLNSLTQKRDDSTSNTPKQHDRT